jgi:hypothetical protein
MKPSGHDRPGGEKLYQRIVTAKFRLELVIWSIEENGVGSSAGESPPRISATKSIEVARSLCTYCG